MPNISALVTASSLELEQPVELEENVFGNGYQTHRRPTTMTERATEVIADRGCGAVIGKLTQTGLVCTGYCRIIGKTAGYSTTKKP